MNIVLYGFMGAGKSTLGRALAEKLGYHFFDLDAEIELHEAMTINDIFIEKGEIAFRQLEHRILKKYIRKNIKNVILSLGGGAIIAPNNRQLLDIRNYTYVYINVQIDILIKRLIIDRDNRPLLRLLPDEQLEQYIKALYESRKAAYQKYAHITIPINKEDFDTSLEKIYLHLNFN